MKILGLVLALVLFNVNADYDHDNVINEIETLISEYGFCNDNNMKSDVSVFKLMFGLYKSDHRVYVSGSDFYSISLKDENTGLECTMHTDPYDWNCNSVICE